MNSGDHDSTALDQGDQAVQQGTEVLSYGDRAVEKGDEALYAYGPTTTTKGDPNTQKTGEQESKIEVQCATPWEVAPPVPGASRAKYRSLLGSFAEKMINADFCEQTDCQPFLHPNSRATDYFDNRGGASYLIAFLDFHNSHLTNDDIEEMARSSMIKDGVNRPDILTHKPERKDYYEIKPNSRSGRRKGRKKLKNLAGFIAGFQLPYKPGIAYTPPGEIEIATVDVEGVPIEVFLQNERLQPALLVYKFCIRGELKKANRRLGKRVRKMALIGLILGAIIPVEDPIEQPVEDPIDQPVDEPVPMPIPASEDHEFADTPLIVPKPYSGPIEDTFTFRYVRGLPQNPVVGEAYQIVISYESRGETYHTVIEFQVISTANNERRLTSTNDIPLNVAPTDHEPLIIEVRNKLTIAWHQ